MSGPVLIVIGTRPDTIKLIPLYQTLLQLNINTLLCSTGQHAELTHDLIALFQIRPDFDFHIMKPGQDLFDSTTAVLKRAKKLFQKIKPSLVIVQGDTTTAMSAAMAAFYLKIPVAHVEAGLRTNNISRPFPEEMNRRFITLVASFHFAPTQMAAQQLFDEGVDPDRVFCTGNTVVDALYQIIKLIDERKLLVSAHIQNLFASLKNKKIVLLTAHRRESFSEGLQHIFCAMKTALKNDPHLHIIFPKHPNPAIQRALTKTRLDHIENMHVIEPLPYQDLVYTLMNVDGIATDSGGIQEEGISLQIPVVILREETDRPEGVENGLAILAGTNEEMIVSALSCIQKRKNRRSGYGESPYGDGTACEQIACIIKTRCL
ncbi:MAG: UDP-N-acetylglucosamine 2-epimerase [Parachlamydiales bacterium]|nr:UDP-N-acetylglucosamine 2-epimerase [Parachlamydiales bacterium]